MSSVQEAKEYAKDNGLFFMETSAKTATNVEELFKAIGNQNPHEHSCCSSGAVCVVFSQKASEGSI